MLGGCGAGSTSSPSASPKAFTAFDDGSARRPNIVFVLTDDLSSDLLAYMPHVRSLERRGTRFSKYVVSDSLCCPSRTSIFTGNYPHTTGVFNNTGKDGGIEAFTHGGNEKATFAIALQAAGYRTGLLGKYINGYDPKRRGIPRGWDSWAVTNEGYAEYNYALNVQGKPVFHRRAPRDYLTTVLRRQALAFLDKARTNPRPFMLEVSTFAPHSPATPAPVDRKKLVRVRAPRDASFDARNKHAPRWLATRQPLSARQLRKIDVLYRRRARSVLAVDRTLAALEQKLTVLGALKNTYVVFSSDNGFHTGQHRLTPGKLTPFDSDIRVPLVVAGPSIRAGATIDRITQNVDLCPTFEDWAGAARGKTDGRSLARLLEHRPEPRPWRRAALIEHNGDDLDPIDPDEQSAASGRPITYKALRTAKETYVEYRDGERELYEDARDPLQRDNVIGTASRAKIARLHAELARLAACRGQRCSTHGP